MARQSLGKAVMRAELDRTGLSQGLKTAERDTKTTMDGMERQVTSASKKMGSSLKGAFDVLTSLSLPSVLGTGGLVASMMALTKESFNTTTGLRLLDRQMERNNISYTEGHKTLNALAEQLHVLPSDLADGTTQLLRQGLSMDEISTAYKAGAASSLAYGRTAKNGIDGVTDALVTGRSIALNSIGISQNLDQGYRELAKSLGKTTEQLTQQERAQAAVNLIQKATVEEVADLPLLMSGYGGAVSDLTTNLKKLRLEIGDKLEPAITSITDVVSAAVGFLADMPDWLSTAVANMALLTTGVTSLGIAVGVLKVALGALGGPVGIIFTVLGALALLSGALMARKTDTEKFADAMDKATTAVGSSNNKEGLLAAIDDLAESATGSTLTSLQTLRAEIEANTGAFNDMRDASLGALNVMDHNKLVADAQVVATAAQLRVQQLEAQQTQLISSGAESSGASRGRVVDLNIAQRDIRADAIAARDRGDMDTFNKLVGQLNDISQQLVTLSTEVMKAPGTDLALIQTNKDLEQARKDKEAADKALALLTASPAATPKPTPTPTPHPVATGVDPQIAIDAENAKRTAAVLAVAAQRMKDDAQGPGGPYPDTLRAGAMTSRQLGIDRVAAKDWGGIAGRAVLEFWKTQHPVVEIDPKALAFDQSPGAANVSPVLSSQYGASAFSIGQEVRNEAGRAQEALNAQIRKETKERSDAWERARSIAEKTYRLRETNFASIKTDIQGFDERPGSALSLGSNLSSNRGASGFGSDLARLSAQGRGLQNAQNKVLAKENKAHDELVAQMDADIAERKRAMDIRRVGMTVQQRANVYAEANERHDMVDTTGPEVQSIIAQNLADQQKSYTDWLAEKVAADTKAYYDQSVADAELVALKELEIAQRKRAFDMRLKGMTLEERSNRYREANDRHDMVDTSGAPKLPGSGLNIISNRQAERGTFDFDAAKMFADAVADANAQLGKTPSGIDRVIKSLEDMKLSVQDDAEKLAILNGLLDDLAEVKAVNKLHDQMTAVADVVEVVAQGLKAVVNTDWTSPNDVLENMSAMAGSVAALVPELAPFAGAITAAGSALSEVMGDMSTGFEQYLAFQRQVESTQKSFKFADPTDLMKTHKVSRGGLLGLFGLTKTEFDADASELGLSIAHAIEDGVVSGLRKGMDAYLDTGSIEDLELGLKEGIYTGVKDALFAAILQDAVLTKMLGPMVTKLAEQLVTASETGDYSGANATLASLKAMVPKIAATLAPVFDWMKEQMPDPSKVGEGAKKGRGAQISEITGPSRDLLTDLLSPLASFNSMPNIMIAQLDVQRQMLQALGGGTGGTNPWQLPPGHMFTRQDGSGGAGGSGAGAGGVVIQGDLVVQTKATDARTLYSEISTYHAFQVRGKRG